jgi:GrpB-like predicted nucleotidyltransferase (UPF0157 family)
MRRQTFRVSMPSDEQIRPAIVICDYDPSWSNGFRELESLLMAKLGTLVRAVEHVGSTAVPGLAAKPILDIDVVIDSWREFDAVKLKLEALGYRHEGDLGIPEREAFRWTGGAPAHHLYVCASSSPELQRHLKFRNILKADPVLAARYAALKRSAAERYRHDREGYTGAKAAFIEAVLQ